MVELFRIVDIYFYTFIMLMFLLSYIVIHNSIRDYGTMIYLFVIISCSTNLLLEASSWLLNTSSNPGLIPINYILNSFLIANNTIPVVAWLIYFDYKIFKDIHKVIQRGRLYFIPFIINVIMLIANAFHPFIFSISDTNTYSRHNGLYISAAMAYTLYFTYFLKIRKYKKQINGSLATLLVYLAIIPAVGGLFQVFFFGVTLIWPLMATLAILGYIYLEGEEMFRDPLTGLFTRGQFTKQLEQFLKNDVAFSLIMIDMDNFKTINDTYGHEEGDDALIICSNILKSSVRNEDLIYRYAGDEFMLIIQSCEEEQSVIIKQRINEHLQKLNKRKAKNYNLSMSYGTVYVENPTTCSFVKLIRKVDTLMYEEKKTKKKEAIL